MSRRLPNYIRTFRLRTGLSQHDLAFLMGSRGGAKVSRYERRVREPNLRTLLALEIIFGLRLAELFAGIHEDVTKVLSRKAKLLVLKLERQKAGCRVIERTPFLRELYESRKTNSKRP